MFLWVKRHRDLDMVALRRAALAEFGRDREMVEFALGQVAVWEAATLGHLTRRRSARDLLRRDHPDSALAVAEFLSSFPQAVIGRYIEIASMTRPMLAESIAEDEQDVAGRVRHLNVKRAIYDLLPNDRVTVAGFFGRSATQRSVLVDIVRTYEGGEAL